MPIKVRTAHLAHMPGAVVEEFQKVRGAFRLALQISPVEKHALQIASFAEDVHKVGQVWPCQLHHLLCMRTGKPMPKAKWYVRTVCSHRHIAAEGMVHA